MKNYQNFIKEMEEAAAKIRNLDKEIGDLEIAREDSRKIIDEIDDEIRKFIEKVGGRVDFFYEEDEDNPDCYYKGISLKGMDTIHFGGGYFSIKSIYIESGNLNLTLHETKEVWGTWALGNEEKIDVLKYLVNMTPEMIEQQKEYHKIYGEAEKFNM